MGVFLKELARKVGGEIVGDPDFVIEGADQINRAGPTEATFAQGEKNFKKLANSKAGLAVVSVEQVRSRANLEEFRSQKNSSIPEGMNLLLVEDPLDVFIEILKQFRPIEKRPESGVSPAAFISPTAQIGLDCNIFPGVTIGDRAVIGDRCDLHPGVTIGPDCQIGSDCVFFPQVVLYSGVCVGNRVRIHANAVIGADGFGYRFRNGTFEKIPQLGTVILEDDVEIGACTTIDRGMIGATRVGAGTKLDNLIMIGHNCELGKHNAFASQVGLAGSVTTGDYVRCAGQVGIADHVHLGEGSVYGAKAGIHRDMPGGVNYLGAPVTEESEQIKIVMALRKLPELRQTIRQLEKHVAKLTSELLRITKPSGTGENLIGQ